MSLKKIWRFILSFILVFGNLMPVKAKEPTLLVTVDKDTVYVGDTVTFTVSVSDGAGRVEISGAVNDSVWLENSSTTYTVTATSAYAGSTITVSASGNLSEWDYDTEPDIFSKSDSATVTVLESSSSESSDEEPTYEEPTYEEPTYEEPEPEELSSDARLYSLTVDKGELSPSFSSSETEYTVELTSKETEITLTAYAWDDNATVSGDGLKPLSVGANSFTIDVTAEDGTRKAYTVNVNVKEVAEIFFTVDDTKLGILNEVNLSDVPKGFTEKKITIQEKEVKAYTNSAGTLTLIYMTDDNDNKGFYIYDEKTGEVLGLYRPVLVDGQEYYALNIDAKAQAIENMTLSTVNLEKAKVTDDKEVDEKVTGNTNLSQNVVTTATEYEAVDAYVFNDEALKQYAIVYLMNNKGETDFYVYNSDTKEMKVYPKENKLTADEIEKFATEKQAGTSWLLYGGIALVIVAVACIAGFVWFKKGKKKKLTAEKKQEPKERNPKKPHNRQLVTDDTFFQEIPKEDNGEPILGDDGVPLSIENALKDMDDDLEETKEITKAAETSEDEQEDEDWLSDDVLHSFLDDQK